jgi:hypothetical protein
MYISYIYIFTLSLVHLAVLSGRQTIYVTTSNLVRAYIGKDLAVARFNVLSRHIPGGKEENYETPQPR